MARGVVNAACATLVLLAVALTPGARADAPARPPRPLTATQLAATQSLSVSLYHGCTTLTNGHAICWGYAGTSNLGLGTGSGSGTSSTLSCLRVQAYRSVLAARV